MSQLRELNFNSWHKLKPSMLYSLQLRLVLIKLWSLILKPDPKCQETLPCQQGLSQVSLLITANKYFNSGTFGRKGWSGALCLAPYEEMTTEICSAWLIFYAEIHWVCSAILVACFALCLLHLQCYLQELSGTTTKRGFIPAGQRWLTSLTASCNSEGPATKQELKVLCNF